MKLKTNSSPIFTSRPTRNKKITKPVDLVLRIFAVEDFDFTVILTWPVTFAASIEEALSTWSVLLPDPATRPTDLQFQHSHWFLSCGTHTISCNWIGLEALKIQTARRNGQLMTAVPPIRLKWTAVDSPVCLLSRLSWDDDNLQRPDTKATNCPPLAQAIGQCRKQEPLNDRITQSELHKFQWSCTQCLPYTTNRNSIWWTIEHSMTTTFVVASSATSLRLLWMKKIQQTTIKLTTHENSLL